MKRIQLKLLEGFFWNISIYIEIVKSIVIVIKISISQKYIILNLKITVTSIIKELQKKEFFKNYLRTFE